MPRSAVSTTFGSLLEAAGRAASTSKALFGATRDAWRQARVEQDRVRTLSAALAESQEEAVAAARAAATSREQLSVLSIELETVRDALAKCEQRVAELTTDLAIERVLSEDGRGPLAGGPLTTRSVRRRVGLEDALEDRLAALLDDRTSTRVAVVADEQGLLVASSGDRSHDVALAAAAALASTAAARIRDMVPLAAPLELSLMDAERTVFTTRWIGREPSGIVLATLGRSAEPVDPRAEAVGASITDLLAARSAASSKGGDA